MTIILPGQNIKMDTLTGIEPIWYGKIKELIDTVNALTGAAPPVPTAMALLETIPMTGAASYASSVSWAGYSHIKAIVSSLNLSTQPSIPFVRVNSNGGVQATATYNTGATFINSLNAAGPVFSGGLGGTALSGMYIYGSSNLTVAGIADGVSCEITFYNVNNTTKHKYMQSIGAMNNGPSYLSLASGMWTGGTTALDGFQLLAEAGATLTGKLQIYGIT